MRIWQQEEAGPSAFRPEPLEVVCEDNGVEAEHGCDGGPERGDLAKRERMGNGGEHVRQPELACIRERCGSVLEQTRICSLVLGLT